jgi:outer membrane protein OmpA-like peptidoglycan-associated protein
MRTLQLLAAGLLVASPVLAQTPKGALGSRDPGLFNLKGSLYYLAEDTEAMPKDLAHRKVEGTLYTDRLDVPIREFTEGFPGVSKRFEWFGLLYTGKFQVQKPGKYRWIVESDDGSLLWVDGKEVVSNDGIHSAKREEGEIELAAGPHDLKVWFFQGPATELGIQLFVQAPGWPEERIFVLGDFSAGLSDALKKVGAQATTDGIKVELDAAVLFDTAKWDLKPAARDTLANVVKVIQSYPGCSVRVEGHTDSVGDEASNLTLSKRRAESVAAALKAAGAGKDVRFESNGFGKSRPVASNDTDKGRAKNRRVELFIRP